MFWTIQLPLEIIAVLLIAYGYKHEDELIEFEERLWKVCKNLLKKILTH